MTNTVVEGSGAFVSCAFSSELICVHFSQSLGSCSAFVSQILGLANPLFLQPCSFVPKMQSTDQAVPQIISHNPALLASLPYPFHAPMSFEGPHKFDASHFVGAFAKPDVGASSTSHFCTLSGRGFVSRTTFRVPRS